MNFANITSLRTGVDSTIIECQCNICKKLERVRYSTEEYELYNKAIHNNTPLTNVFKNMDNVKREFLISGMCYNCQKLYFGSKISREAKKSLI